MHKFGQCLYSRLAIIEIQLSQDPAAFPMSGGKISLASAPWMAESCDNWFPGNATACCRSTAPQETSHRYRRADITLCAYAP
jgi:hypothetical protein